MRFRTMYPTILIKNILTQIFLDRVLVAELIILPPRDTGASYIIKRLEKGYAVR